ncbi:MAG TPA: GtrA family protein [Candidatus Pacearchaeota archaeon]|nr:GtrA family protein [Candidatus Pacearchaeota archaeon]
MCVAKHDILSAVLIAEIDAAVLIYLSRNFTQQINEVPWLAMAIPWSWVYLPLLAIVGIFFANFLAKMTPTIWQLAKFLLVGTSNVFVDLGVLGFLQEISPIFFIAYPAAKFISASCAVANSFFWNKFWSFEKKDTSRVQREAIMFLSVAGIGIFLNSLIASFIVAEIPPFSGLTSKAWGIFAGFVATMIVFVWDFLGYKLIVFKK